MSLQIALQNQTDSNTVYAYITGTDNDNGDKLFLLQADGVTPYYPDSPSDTGAALAQDCAIPLGAPGNTVFATIPHLSGSRIWFVIDDTLEFLLNPGPGLVEPSVMNSADANIAKKWDFAEFSYNTSQIYANITYVDFASVPVSLTLSTASGTTKHVSGMDASGFDNIVSKLNAQTAADSQPWGSLVVNQNGSPLRALSPNSYIGSAGGAFDGYFADYVSSTWSKYASEQLTVDTQAFGTVTGQTNGSDLTFSDGSKFAQPSAADIFSCSTGPFAGGEGVTDEQLNIGARLAAALNRSTLASSSLQPNNAAVSDYYAVTPTNHYGRIIHEVNLDGKGYAFPYDDVTPTDGADQSGYVNAGDPTLLTVAVGGNNATASLDVVKNRQAQLLNQAPKNGTKIVDQPQINMPEKGSDTTNDIMSRVKGFGKKAWDGLKKNAKKLNCFSK